MAELSPEGTTTEVVDIEGVKVFRTTTIKDQAAEDIQHEIDGLATSIVRAQDRAVTPLEARKAELEASLAELEA